MGTESLVHEVRSDDLRSERPERTDSNLDGLHRREHAQLVGADQELRAGDRLNDWVKSSLKPIVRVERLRSILQHEATKPSHEDRICGGLPWLSCDKRAGAQPSEGLGDGVEGVTLAENLLAVIQIVVLVPLLHLHEILEYEESELINGQGGDRHRLWIEHAMTLREPQSPRPEALRSTGTSRKTVIVRRPRALRRIVRSVSSTEPVLEAQVSPDAQCLLDALPTTGAARGNRLLWEDDLSWDEDRFFEARNELIDLGLAQKWRGPGGTLRRAQAVEVDPEVGVEVPAEVAAEYNAERDLYQPMLEVLAGRWAADNRLEPCVAAEIGLQGKRRTGGKWSRPDLVLVAIQSYAFVPGKHLSVVTFEVKLGPALDVTAVYEALAHRRASTHSIVLVHADGHDPETLTLVVEEAARHGVGVILAIDPADYDTWDSLLDPVRHEADPWSLNTFISVQLPIDERGELTAFLAAGQ